MVERQMPPYYWRTALISSTNKMNVAYAFIAQGAIEIIVETAHKDFQFCRSKATRRIKGTQVIARITAGNTITLEGTLINGTSFTPIATKTNLLAALDTKTTEHSKTSNNLVWQTTQSKGTTNQVMHLTNINVPVGMSNFQGAGGITVQLPKNASLTEQITSLAKQPGNEYLTDLAARSDIDWQRVEVINKSCDYKK